MNHPFTTKHAFIFIVAIATVLIIGMASAGTFYGDYASIKIKNKGETNYTNAKLAFYMDAPDAQCTDSDGGFKPKDGGHMTFMDSQGAMQLVFETCVGAKKLAELSCINKVDVLEAGKPKHDYALITTVDCANKCVQGTGIFATAKCA